MSVYKSIKERINESNALIASVLFTVFLLLCWLVFGRLVLYVFPKVNKNIVFLIIAIVMYFVFKPEKQKLSGRCNKLSIVIFISFMFLYTIYSILKGNFNIITGAQLLICLESGIAEEIIFHILPVSFIPNDLIKNKKISIIIVLSVLFGLFHITNNYDICFLQQFLYTIFFSIFLLSLCFDRKNEILIIVLHFINNYVFFSVENSLNFVIGIIFVIIISYLSIHNK